MTKTAWFTVCIALLVGSPAAAQSDTKESDAAFVAASDSHFDEASLRKLNEEISDAPAEQIFAVHLVFDELVSVGEIHATALQLRIPRVLAYVEYGTLFVDRPRNFLMLGLGEMYSGDVAMRHTRCRALISASYGEENELRGEPIDSWRVGKIQVYATAHAIRELLAGSVLPAAAILDGSSAKPEHVQKLWAYTEYETSQKIEVSANFDAPEQCRRDVAPIDAPILVAEFDPALRQLPRLEDDDFRSYAFRVLATFPPDAAVTIQLKLDFKATVDVLASLVWQYGIEGMTAQLIPERSDKRVFATPELSVHGESLGDQVKRARCQMRWGDGPETRSEWYADWVSVSMPLNKAWVFLSYPKLAQAEVLGSFPGDDLKRLEAYFERRSEKVTEVPAQTKIPPGCDHIYRHP